MELQPRRTLWVRYSVDVLRALSGPACAGSRGRLMDRSKP